jgi:glycerol-3-phosphate dehydrogenase
VLDVDLRRDDVVGTYAGLRPLIAPSSGSTVTASREHRVVVEANRLVRVGGGKYTTYRVMARDAIDAVVRELDVDPKRRPSGTATLPLVGAADRDALAGLARRLGEVHGLPAGVATRLVDRHGTQAAEVAGLGAEEGLLNTLGPDIDQLEAEVAWAAREELAQSLDDVLARRMRLAQELPDRAASIVPRVAKILARELGWDEARRDREGAAFLESARREYSVP